LGGDNPSLGEEHSIMSTDNNGGAETRKLKARVAKLLDEAWQERRRRSKEHVRDLLDDINGLGCNDAAIAKLLKISRASVSKGGKPIRFEVQDKDKRMAQDAMRLHELKWASGLTWLKIASLLGISKREAYNLHACRKEMRTKTKVVLDALLAKYSKGRMQIPKKEEL